MSAVAYDKLQMDIRGQIWLPFSLIRARKLAKTLLFVVLTYHSDQFETVFSFNIFLISAVRLGCKHIIRSKLKTLWHFHCSYWWVGSIAFKKTAVLDSYQKVLLSHKLWVHNSSWSHAMWPWLHCSSPFSDSVPCWFDIFTHPFNQRKSDCWFINEMSLDYVYKMPTI